MENGGETILIHLNNLLHHFLYLITSLSLDIAYILSRLRHWRSTKNVLNKRELWQETIEYFGEGKRNFIQLT